MTPEDVIYRYRLRTLALAREIGSVRAACRVMGIHHSTYYRWKSQADSYGLTILRPRERRRPQMPNAISPLVEHRILAFAIGNPGLGPSRIAAELARPKWGGFQVSPSGIWRVLRRNGLNTRSKRLALVAGYAAPPGPQLREPGPERHLEVDRPGELVQFDCFHIGRLTGTRGTLWQYTAIDVASAFVWAELHATPRNPSSRWTSRLARRVARDLSARGWKLEKVMTDNGSEFRAKEFGRMVAVLGARQKFIHAGRPQTNGCVERVQGTILEECWKPAFARYLVPKQTGLRRELNRYLRYYNRDRAHTGRWNRGRTPEEVIGKSRIYA